ncbi:MAG: hypothetical protein EPN73_22330 [Paraburkholderia sp.]|uniref:hypothetical protein n=1 Tax=Paraburkholderia sp. TaxID=1926495 RepID=UPI00122053D3|nr:hypothetical protein [Paraburkholderia sp.]TAL93117.1 MAG: hypothetical protein EPN73_22330 [Paraburkholderia sp.]
MLEFQVRIEDMPRIFRAFSGIVGEASWNKVVHSKKQHSKNNAFLREHYEREYAVAFQLAKCSELMTRYGKLPAAELARLHQACGFSGQALSILESLSAKHRKALVGRIQGALKNPDDMRGLLLEISTATHFVRRGNRVLWPEFQSADSPFAGQTYDLFIEDVGPNGLEVECKSVSDDKGRKLHQEELLAFQQLVKRRLEPFSKNLKSGVAVILTVPDRLPKSRTEQEELADRVRTQVLLNESKEFDDGTSVRIIDFDVALLKDVPMISDSPAVRAVIERVTGARNRNAMIMGRPNVGATVFVPQSARSDNVLVAAFETAADAAKRQLTKTRPGLLVLGFDGMDADRLRSVAEHDFENPGQPTALRMGVTQFLSSESRDHVVGVGFVSRGTLTPQSDGALDTGGSVYSFRKEESSLWHDDFNNIFGPNTTESATPS